MMGRLNALTCLCILVLAVVQPAVAGWTVDNLTGRAELSRPGNDGSILLTRGSELKGDKGTLALSQGSSLRLRYSDGSALSLSSGSVLKFIKGGLWLKLKSGRILLELGKELAGKLRLGFLSSVVRASGSGTFSLSVSKSGKQVLFVVAGAVSVARKGFSRVIQKGMKAAWVKGELKTRSFVSEKLKGWWANTMGVAAVLLPAEKKAEKESKTPIISLPSLPKRVEVAANIPTVSPLAHLKPKNKVFEQTIPQAPGAVSAVLPAIESFPLGTILGTFVLFVGLLALVANSLRKTALNRRANHAYSPSGIVSALLTKMGFGARCSSCSGEVEEGVIVSVAVEADVDRYRPSLMAYESGEIMDSIWDDLVKEVKARRLMGRGVERVTLKYSRCSGCLRSIYRLCVGKDVLAEYAGHRRAGSTSGQHTGRLGTFVQDYDPYHTTNSF